jgi:hypothetical protein
VLQSSPPVGAHHPFGPATSIPTESMIFCNEKFLKLGKP